MEVIFVVKGNVFKVFLVVILLFGIAGCGFMYPELDSNAIGFEVSEFIDENDFDNASYLAIEYNGRTYLPYGTLRGVLKAKDIDRCIGYVIQDENSSAVNNKYDTDTRIYILSGDAEVNFLMEYYIASDLMNIPLFYRAIDTKGKDVFVPGFIDSLDYNYWKEY